MIRFFDETSYAIEKSFISFTPVLKLDAASITDCIWNNLETLGLDYKSSLIDLGFDGASVMRGQLSSVQKHTHNKAPFAYYTCSYGHRLNLVLINTIKPFSGAADFFSLLENLYIFINEKFLEIQ